MKNTTQQFKDAIDKAYATEPNVQMNNSTISDALKYKQNFTEEEVKNNIEGLTHNQKQMVDGIIDIVKKIENIKNRKAIAIDMVEKFKKEKIKFDYSQFLKSCGIKPSKKVESVEATGTGSSGAYSAPLFSGEQIDSDKVETKEATGTGSSGGFVSPIGFSDDFMKKSNAENKKLTKESDSEKVEAKEATSSGSSGGYVTPAAWAKSTSKKDWGGRKKTQIPGGSFVSIKKKCTKFPYCNKGDINALNIYKNESVAEAITNVSKKLNISENVIKAILQYELEKKQIKS